MERGSYIDTVLAVDHTIHYMNIELFSGPPRSEGCYSALSGVLGHAINGMFYGWHQKALLLHILLFRSVTVSPNFACWLEF